jgi:hypothetical protein
MGWQDDPVVAQVAPWERDPVVERRAQPRVAKGVWEAATAGYQGSYTGLANRGKLPDIVLDSAGSKWYERLAAGATQMAMELPAMVAGGMVGGVTGSAAGPAGTIVGTGAGAFAVPTAIRESLIQAYEKGEVVSVSDFLSRVGIVAKSTSKDAAVGGLTLGTGGVAARTVGKAIAPAIGETLSVGGARAAIGGAQLTAELGTMTVAPAALAGHLPEPKDFLDAAILVGGLKGSGAIAGKIATIYRKAGVPPEKVVADAAADPTIKEDLTRPVAETAKAADTKTVPAEGSPLVKKAQTALAEISALTDKYKNEGAVATELNGKMPDRDRAMARAAEAHWDELSPQTREFLGPRSAKDWETGESIQAADSVRGTHIFDLRTLAESEQAQPFDVPRAYQALAAEQNARAAVPGEKAQAFVDKPFAEIPQAAGEPAQPSHVNYNYINTTDDVKGAMSRLSQLYEADITEQRRGTVSWEQTQAEAGTILEQMLGGKVATTREPGTAAAAAELLARKQMAVGAAEDLMRVRDEVLAKGSEATSEDTLRLLAAAERTAMIQSEFLGARAEAGRALNILKDTARDAERVKQIQEILDVYGKSPEMLAKMLKEVDTPEGAFKAAGQITKATTWEKVVEAIKAGMISGPITQIANFMGNTTFAALRLPVEMIASGIGFLRGAPADRVTAMEPIARLTGNVHGALDALAYVGKMLRVEGVGATWDKWVQMTDSHGGKTDTKRGAIEGKKGQIIRTLTFGQLTAVDAFFKTMNERGEAYSLATRQATAEGLNPFTREFRERVADLAQNPDAEMQKQITAAGERLTFNTKGGELAQATQKFVKTWHLEMLVPFIQTPGNIAKELLRMTPAAPAFKEWRQAWSEGGAARDKAVAEVMVGGAMGAVAYALSTSDMISGAGDPDPNKKRVKMASGWQPYSIRIGDTWYSYQRLQPVGTLLGMYADAREVQQHMTPEEKDKIPKMLAVAMGNAITSQTFLQGFANIIHAITEPDRYGAKLAQGLAGLVIPGVVSQNAQLNDPYIREIDSVLDAVKNRLPFARETLIAQRDAFGEPIKNRDRVAVVSPIVTNTVSDDPVRKEAARLGVGVAKAPKKIHIGTNTGKIGDVELKPEERDVFASEAGKLAHQVMSQAVKGPNWENLPDIVKRRVFDRVFESARKVGAFKAIEPDRRKELTQDIIGKMHDAMSAPVTMQEVD